MAKRIVSTVIDYDMHYLFPPLTPMQNLEDASQGTYEKIPKKILRERSYDPMPIRLRPDYRGNFLEQLEEKQWVDTGMKFSANPYNIYDYSMPEEMLKQQQHSMPDDRTDIFIERNKPGDLGGMQTLRDWYDRGWDDIDAPEWSEDKILRMWKAPIPKKSDGPDPNSVISAFMLQNDDKKGPQVNTVIANWMMQYYPMSVPFDNNNIKLAARLSELEKAERWSGTKNRYIPIESGGVSVRLYRAEPRRGRWIFRTTSGGPVYTTVFQFVPRANIRDTSKLDVRVSCSCPSWVFWGAQWNAWQKEYLYGKARLKLLPPRVRDPKHRFFVCKHVLACIPIVSRYRLMTIKPKVKRKIQKKPKLVFEKGKKEKIRIPTELKNFAKQPEIKKAEKNWEKWTSDERDNFIKNMDSPGAVAYLGHKFPETAAAPVAERLKEMSKTLSQPSHRRLAEKYSQYFV